MEKEGGRSASLRESGVRKFQESRWELLIFWVSFVGEKMRTGVCVRRMENRCVCGEIVLSCVFMFHVRFFPLSPGE